MTTAKDRIRTIFGCGLSDMEKAPDFSDAFSLLENSTISLPNSNDSNFFRPNSLSKAILVGLSETCINNSGRILDFRKKFQSTPVITEDDTSLKDLSYDPNCTVKTIKQHQKSLSPAEIQTIIVKYKYGATVKDLAKQFNCNRYTVSRALKANGIEVSKSIAQRKVIPEMIMQLYADYYRPKDIGEILSISADTVKRILRKNNVYIRQRWEYPPKGKNFLYN